MGLMILADLENAFLMWILLAAAIGLSVWELVDRDTELKVSIWWVLLVLLTHVVGYIALRFWLAGRDKE